jgi:hypothetical protein
MEIFKETRKAQEAKHDKENGRKMVRKGKSDIREKIEERRQRVTKRLQGHQKLLKETKDIQMKNERDARFLPHLEEAIEKNRILRIFNYNDHINKV